MSLSSSLRIRLSERALAMSVSIDGDVLDGICVYLELLERWNRRINLTAFDLVNATDAALDRLAIEPLLGAQYVRAEDRMGVDIGSGGGSPGFPLKLACPTLHLVLVESRMRKAAFLREVARTLGIDVQVETCRFEEFATREENLNRFDVVSLRAVRTDEAILDLAADVMGGSGRMLWFGGVGQHVATRRFEECAMEGTLRVLALSR